ncbi:MAG: cytochrome c4 [Pseudomonadota bacterium]|nr:cytochrome c4 [Pseudomonadota bacterium]
MKKTFAIAATCALLGFASAVWAAGDPAAGKDKAAACAACHGADGNSASGQWPKLAGQHADYLVKQLQNFKSGDRVNATMNGMAAPLSDQDIEDLAAYFASQQPTRGEANPELVEVGQQLFRGGNLANGVPACMACHGANGAGNPAAKFPALAGQHAEYTASQLQAFRALQRANDAGQMMRNIAQKMTDQEIQAVASYVQGLR